MILLQYAEKSRGKMLSNSQGQGTPWTRRQPIAVPSLTSNGGFSILLKDTSTCSSQLSPEPRFEPATFQSLADCPLSYHRPTLYHLQDIIMHLSLTQYQSSSVLVTLDAPSVACLNCTRFKAFLSLQQQTCQL